MAQKAKACQVVAELSWLPNYVLVPCTALLCFHDEVPVAFVHPWFGWDINFVESVWRKCAELRILSWYWCFRGLGRSCGERNCIYPVRDRPRYPEFVNLQQEPEMAWIYRQPLWRMHLCCSRDSDSAPGAKILG